MIKPLDIQKYIAAPAAPTVTPTGGASGHHTYKLVAKLSNGGPGGSGAVHSAAGSATAITNGPTTLDGTHYNTVTGAVVPGADGYDAYLTATTGAATLGKIGSCTDPTVGVVHNSETQGDATTAPTTNDSGVGAASSCSGDDKTVQVDGTFAATCKLQGSIGGQAMEDIAGGGSITAAKLVNVVENVQMLRVIMSAYTSGLPAARVKYDPHA